MADDENASRADQEAAIVAMEKMVSARNASRRIPARLGGQAAIGRATAALPRKETRSGRIPCLDLLLAFNS